MQEYNYYVVLKENVTFDIEAAKKIENMQLPTPEERFSFKDIAIEVYGSGTYEECTMIRNDFGDEMKILFDVKSKEELTKQ